MSKDIELTDVAKTSPDLLVGRLNELKKLFPDLFDGEGNLNESELKNLVNQYNNPQVEKFTFEWAGKSHSKKLAFKPSKATLIPDGDRSVDFENTENLIIEGDNLEVLKLLQKSYYEKVKCIYIDPPYNTGNDFIYADNYSDSKKAYWEKNGQVHDGVKMDSNAESNGRLHSNWLDMMQSRLLLARRFLKEDGVIFVSIDDNEVHNLRKLMDEVFGEENLISTLVWDLGTGTQAGHFVRAHEYVLAYANNKSVLPNFSSEGGIIEHSALKKISKKNPASEFIFPKGTRFDAPSGVELTGIWGGSESTELVSGKMYSHKGKLAEDVTLRAGWAQKNQMMSWFNNEETFDTKGQLVKEFYFNSNGILRYIKEKSVINPPTVIKNLGSTKTGTTEIESFFNFGEIFPFPKPTTLIKFLLGLFEKEDIFMDFFAGSGTTGHAVMDLNKEDGGNRKFILVQLPEYTGEKSEAYKAGYKRISDITIERVKRAGTKIKEEKNSVDTGFKVFSLQHSNFRDNTWTPDAGLSEEENTNAFKTYLDNADQPRLFEDAKNDEHIITEMALKQGFELDFDFDTDPSFDKNIVIIVKNGAKEFLLCLDKILDDATVDQLIEMDDKKFICLKNSLNTTHRWKLDKALGRNLEVI